MNDRPPFLKPAGPGGLADAQDFQLGEMRVRPSVREVEAFGKRETIEPRVMQVLVVLAGANGAVVSRDELIRQCWGGRIVGEDAINRCVSKIRQLAEFSGNAFAVETIARVGYKLQRLETCKLPAVPPSTQPEKPKAETAGPRISIPMAGLAVVVAFAAVAAGIYLFKPRSMQALQIAESHQPFIATTDYERFPSFSPDGTMIAYARGTKPWNTQIYLQLRSGGAPLQLTHESEGARAPAFSPDGTAIAFITARVGKPCRIMLAQVPSGPSHEIGHCRTVSGSKLGWARDGRALFYYDQLRSGQFLHIVRLDIHNGALTEVTRSGEGGSLADFQPSVSPDGKTILFMRYLKGDRMQVVLRSLDKGTERVLVDDNADKYADWSSDPSTIFVASNKGTDSSLWEYPADGGAPSRIMSNARVMEFLSSGPDGLLAFELKNKETRLAIASAKAGEPTHELDTNGFAGCSFDFAADGTLAMIANNGDAASIAVGMPGHLREIIRLKGIPPCGIQWSPDGKFLAFGGGEAEGSRISILDRNGAPVTQVPFPTENFGYFEWTPDGKYLLENRLDSRGWRVWKVEVAAPHKEVPLLPYGWDWVRIRNNMTFGMKHGSSGIWRIDGVPRRLTDQPTMERAWTWLIEGDRLLYEDISDPDHPLIVAQSIAGGPRVVAGYAVGMDYLSALGIDPATGQAIYNRVIRDDPDIGWLRLVRK
jgi:Tol biopolymer transport system component/DNA-binding winged helix-turn-helix (wHTH) protein